MSAVVDLSRISKHYRNKVRCERVRSLEELNLMFKRKWVISIYHDTMSNMIVYYIDEDDSTTDPRLTTWLGFPMA